MASRYLAMTMAVLPISPVNVSVGVVHLSKPIWQRDEREETDMIKDAAAIGKHIHYSRNCSLRPAIQQTGLKQQVVFEMRVAKTCSCKVNTFFEFEVKSFLEKLHKRWFQAYTSLQQGTCVLYSGPILQVNSSVRAKSGGCRSRLAGSRSPETDSSVQNYPRMEFWS